MTTTTLRGVDGFVRGLTAHGHPVRQQHGLVLFPVVPIDGGLAGEDVDTAVDTAELGNWPGVPPHWVHLPAAITFSRTNSQSSSMPGWLRHSRSIKGWGDNPDPVAAWIAHVRAVLGDAR